MFDKQFKDKNSKVFKSCKNEIYFQSVFTMSIKILLIFALIVVASKKCDCARCECLFDMFVNEYSSSCSNVTLGQGTQDFSVEVIHEEGFANKDVDVVFFQQSVISFNSPAIIDVFPRVYKLHLINVQLEYLIPFERCGNFSELLLYENVLTSIDGEVFSACTNLTLLVLEANLIESVNETTFKGLGKLETLNLIRNLITNISRDVLEPLKNLKYLLLDNNRIEYISENTFSGLQNLKYLQLQGNLINEIRSNAFSGLNSLHHLYFNRNSLQALHKDTFKDLESLRVLALGSNQLNTLNFGLPAALQVLHVNNNRINSIVPQFFKNASSLLYLFLEQNVCIDDYFSPIDDLETQVLPELKACFENYGVNKGNASYCDFSVHPAFGYTCELKEINGTIVSVFDGDHLNGFRNEDVKTVIFTNSTLSNIPKGVVEKFNFVERIIAKNSKIDLVDGKTIENCGNIKHVDLRENDISFVSDEAFEDCENLTSINLSSNQISVLPARLFNKNLNLESIFFDHNVISRIDPCNNVIRFQLKKLKLLSLRWNVCVNNSFRHSILHLLFSQIVFKEIKICYGFFFM